MIRRRRRQLPAADWRYLRQPRQPAIAGISFAEAARRIGEGLSLRPDMADVARRIDRWR